MITLTGSSTINLTVGDTFTDPGATATDGVDGDLTSSITTSGSVDTSTAGIYTISYSVTDAAGNVATVVQRTVIVSVAVASIYFENGTCKCPNASLGDTEIINGVTYTVVNNSTFATEVTNGNVNLCTTWVTSMYGKFNGDTSFNSNINFWDTSNVTDMGAMFFGATSFNQDLDNWDTSKVTRISRMFENATSFNGEINGWDLSGLDNEVNINTGPLFNMFMNATSFNQDISNWNVSSINSFVQVFYGATSFNQDLNNWNTSNATFMSNVFYGATSFNGNIGGWDTSNVTSMSGMFNNATSFNQDLTGWCVSNITTEPQSFATSSALTEDNKPIWGTCPSN